MRIMLSIAFAFMLCSGGHGQTVTHPGFESPALGAGKLQYRPAGSAWTFAGDSGVSANGSAFTGTNPGAPEGGQVCILQKVSQASQSVAAWPAGNYQIVFTAAQRGWPVGCRQVVNVLFDGRLLSSVTPASSSYQTYYSAPFTAGQGDHSIGFAGIVTTADYTAFVDAVKVIPAGSVAAAAKAKAQVATSGKMISLSFTSIADGSPVVPSQLLQSPSISVNGQPLGALATQWATGYHPLALLATPGGYQIRPGDIVRVTASPGWAFVPAGGVSPLDTEIAENRAGRPMLATESFPRTMALGINTNVFQPVYTFSTYTPLANLKYRIAYMPGGNYRGKVAPNGGLTVTVTGPGAKNWIDGTGYPGAAGLWLVMWDAINPANPTQFRITTGTPAQCTVNERLDLAQRPESGIGICRVFDVQPIAGTPSLGFDVSVSCADPAYAGAPNYKNLWIVQPGDWDLTDGQVVLDRSDPLALSRQFVKRIGNGVRVIRWLGTSACAAAGNSLPYPELLTNPTDENWAELSYIGQQIGYTSVSPVDVNRTPWIYSPAFAAQGQTYTAALGADVTTAPPPGTQETWSIPDGAAAPLMAGLVMRIDSEVVRVISGSGTSWVVNRGSNGTTPATHQAGPLTISGRLPITNYLGASGLSGGGTVYQLTTSTPHRRTTGTGFTTGGSGWPDMVMTDGSTLNVQNTSWPAFVTGPTTAFFRIGGPAAGSAPSQVYKLDPTKQFWFYSSYQGIPVEVTARITAKFPRCDFYVNVPMDASDDLVYEMARRTVADFPAGRRVYVEYANEVWNNAFGALWLSQLMSALMFPRESNLPYYPYRSGQIHAIFRNVFRTAGRDGEIHGLINCQHGNGALITSWLEYGFKAGTPFTDAAVSPYWQFEMTPYNQQVSSLLDDEQTIDIIRADMAANTKTNVAWMGSVNGAIAKYNKDHGASVQLVGYESGVSYAYQWNPLRDHDLQYNPNWYFLELDWLAWCQQQGFDRLITSGFAGAWQPEGFSAYHTIQQMPGRGDGLNGATDNLLYRRDRRGAGVNQDSHVDSVRGRAWLDWLGTMARP
jgi:hypothetical protein